MIVIITKEIVEEFNKELAECGCIFYAKQFEDTGRCKLKLKVDNLTMLSNVVLNPSAKFYQFANNFFGSRGIELEYNLVGNIFWEKEKEKEKEEEIIRKLLLKTVFKEIFPATAQGINLDGIGLQFGMPRKENESDNSYRTRIIKEKYLNPQPHFNKVDELDVDN